MTQFRNQDAARRVIEEQAAQWLCDLRDGDAVVQAAFFTWLKRSPRHVEEFLNVSALWKSLDAIGPRDSAAIEQAVHDAGLAETDTNVVALAACLQSNHDKPPRSAGTHSHSKSHDIQRRVGKWSAVAAFVCFLATIAVWLLATRGDSNLYQTAVGEQRAVRLSDGSVLQLNTHSSARVRFSQAVREIELLQGEALFDVEQDPARPFRVLVGGNAVQALGTQFNVYRRAASIDVAVIEGMVQIWRSSNAAVANSTAQKSGSAAVNGLSTVGSPRLKAGEQASIGNDGAILKRTTVDVASAAVWRERRLVFRGERLEDIANEFNRYTSRRIRVEGDQARETRLAGTFSADDPDSLILFLSRYDNLAIEKNAGGFVVRER